MIDFIFVFFATPVYRFFLMWSRFFNINKIYNKTTDEEESFEIMKIYIFLYMNTRSQQKIGKKSEKQMK